MRKAWGGMERRIFPPSSLLFLFPPLINLKKFFPSWFVCAFALH